MCDFLNFATMPPKWCIFGVRPRFSPKMLKINKVFKEMLDDNFRKIHHECRCSLSPLNTIDIPMLIHFFKDICILSIVAKASYILIADFVKR